MTGDAIRHSTYNPYDPAQVDDDADALGQLRDESPVYEFSPGCFLVTTYDDVVRVLLDTETFPQGGFAPGGVAEEDVDELPMGQTDGDVHNKIRRPVASAMTARQLRTYEPVIRTIADDIARRLASMDTADLVAELAGPLPAEAVMQLSGIPSDQMTSVRDYTADFILMLAAENTPEAAAAVERMNAFNANFLDILQRAQAGPTAERPPLLAGLINSTTRDEDPLTERRILASFVKDIVVAGLETTVHLIGNMFFDVLAEPGLYQRLRENPELRADVVEESLRHLPPVNVVFRRAAHDVVLGGTPIPRNAMVVVSLTSANADEQHFECPREFRPESAGRAKGHLAFGRGPHLCVGAPLARLEARCAIDAVLAHVPELAFAAGERYERVEFISVRGPRHLRVRIGH